jgi:Cu+-exporting ATPase
MQTHEPTPGAEVTLPIVGMTCASCVNRVERFLKAADGVAEAQVNLATESATIRYLPDQTGVAELAAAITASGYEVPAAALALAGREPDADVDAARAALSEELAAGRARASRAMLRGGIIATAC